MRCERFGFAARAIPDGKIGAGFGEALGHRVAHAADADPTDRCLFFAHACGVSIPNGRSIAKRQLPSDPRRATSMLCPAIRAGLPSGPVIVSSHLLVMSARSA